jgi:hypothetical protein
MKRFGKPGLLIRGEWGYVPSGSGGSKPLFQVVSECYERKSLIITTNLEFARWNDIFADTRPRAPRPRPPPRPPPRLPQPPVKTPRPAPEEPRGTESNKKSPKNECQSASSVLRFPKFKDEQKRAK